MKTQTKVGRIATYLLMPSPNERSVKTQTNRLKGAAGLNARSNRYQQPPTNGNAQELTRISSGSSKAKPAKHWQPFELCASGLKLGVSNSNDRLASRYLWD
jgi:hypothetical protein